MVVPAVLIKKILKDFHIEHPGISRMKACTKSYVYWCGMDKEIENLVKTCKNCALAAKGPPVKFNLWPKIDETWSRLHIYYAGPIRKIYNFIVVDSFTK